MEKPFPTPQSWDTELLDTWPLTLHLVPALSSPEPQHLPLCRQQFPTAVTNDHSRGCLNPCTSILLQFCRSEAQHKLLGVKTTVSVGLFSLLELWGESLSWPFSASRGPFLHLQKQQSCNFDSPALPSAFKDPVVTLGPLG